MRSSPHINAVVALISWRRLNTGQPLLYRAAVFIIQILTLVNCCCVNATATTSNQPGHRTPLDTEGLSLLEKALLGKMGMKRRPIADLDNSKRPPQALLDMYKMQTAEQLDNRLTGSNRHLDYDSTLGFWPQRIVALSDRDLAFDFELKGIGEDEAVELAELELYLRPSDKTGSFGDSEIDPDRPSTSRLQLYEQVRDHTLLLDSVTVDCRRDVWTSAKLDATVSALRWRRSQLLAQDQRATGRLLVKLTGSLDCRVNLDKTDSKSPVLLVFTNELEDEQEETSSSSSSSSTRVKRNAGDVQDAGDSHRKRRRRRKHKHRQHHQSRHRVQSSDGLCRRHELNIVVSEIGWEHWIMAPQNFSVYYCDGLCPVPLPNRLNSTNHAIIQGLINSVKPEAAPPPCCVPTEMTEISLLYLNEYDIVQLKKYDNMEVASCGCR